MLDFKSINLQEKQRRTNEAYRHLETAIETDTNMSANDRCNPYIFPRRAFVEIPLHLGLDLYKALAKN